MRSLIILLSFLFFVQPCLASDLEREQRLAEQTEELIFDGDVIYLQTDDHEFMNVYTESEDEEAKGAVIILHGRGFHPDWKQVAKPLRLGLTESGWTTLSMQMPVLDKQAKYYDYIKIMDESFPRIEAGIDFLREEGFEKIVLIAHSCSAHMVMAWQDAGRFRNVDAFIGVGMGATDYKQPMPNPMPLDKISVPVLDVYGSAEYPAVARGAGERLEFIRRAGNEKSEQIMVPEADHYFTDQDEALVETINEWLQKL